MFVKQDYDYQELEKLIEPENLQLYYLIKDQSQQDNFVLLIQDHIAEAVTVEELNKFMTEQKNKIQEELKLK